MRSCGTPHSTPAQAAARLGWIRIGSAGDTQRALASLGPIREMMSSGFAAAQRRCQGQGGPAAPLASSLASISPLTVPASRVGTAGHGQGLNVEPPTRERREAQVPER